MGYHLFIITTRCIESAVFRLMAKTVLLVMLAAGVCTGLARDDENENVAFDTCGTYKGIPVVAQHSRYNGGLEERVSILLIDFPPDIDEGGGGTRSIYEFVYQNPDDGGGYRSSYEGGSRFSYKVKKNRLHVLVSDGTGKSLVEFDIYDHTMELSDEWIKNIERLYDREADSTISYFDIIEILESSNTDHGRPLRILNMMRLRGEYRSGMVDEFVSELKVIASDALRSEDDFVASRCRKLLAEINEHHQAAQPLVLTETRKIGRVLHAPVFPPVDSPTVFWKDSLLCVVQENDTMPATKMRFYDPRTKKWGKVVDLHYPESGFRGFYYMGYSRYTNNRYWHDRLPGGAPDDLYTGLPERPLVVISGPVLLYPLSFFAERGDLHLSSNDQVPDYSEMDWKYLHGMLKKAGGSCIAGKGRIVFTRDGAVSIGGDTGETWKVLPDPLVLLSRSEEYTVVVSPDQMWVCYAVRAADNDHKIELRVSRIDYRDVK